MHGGLDRGLIKLLWDLYYFPRHHEFTPVSDDWPPDGSIRFVECGTVSWKSIPETYRNYEFSPNEDAYDHRIGGAQHGDHEALLCFQTGFDKNGL